MILALGPVIVQPHATHGLEAHWGAEQGTNQRNEIAKDGNGASDDVGDHCDAESASEPDDPVLDGVGGQMAGAVEDADEDVFASDLENVRMKTQVGGIFSWIIEQLLTWTNSNVLTIRPGSAKP